MSPFSWLRPVLTFAGPLCLAAITLTPVNSQDFDYGIRIYLDSQQRVAVESVRLPPEPSVLAQPGMLLWSEGQRDRWQVLPAKFNPNGASPPLAPLPALAGASRGTADDARLAALPMQTVSLDQLIAGEVLRNSDAAAWLTPLDQQMILRGTPTLRRKKTSSPADKDAADRQSYPQARFRLSDDSGTTVTLTFPAGRPELTWSQLDGLPQPWRQGLPPGEYTLQFVATEDGAAGDEPTDQAAAGEEVTFGVEAPRYGTAVLAAAERYRRAADDNLDAVYVQLAAEAMLAAKDEEGLPAPYLSDAYDLLQRLPAGQQTAYLRRLRGNVAAKIHGRRGPAEVAADATGIGPIDTARQRILAGRWRAAEQALQDPQLRSDPRGQALARLYQAVILSESGAATGAAAYAAFVEALESMEASESMEVLDSPGNRPSSEAATSPPADRFRAFNNFANFLLGRAQDRLYDHAFQVASGVAAPLFAGLNDWHQARVHYARAAELAELAEKLSPVDAASVQVNVARQYALLADYLRVLNSAFPAEQAWLEGQQAAEATARGLAERTLAGTEGQVDPATRATAHMLLARLAYRNDNPVQAILHAEQARPWYLADGALGGVERVHRMIGLSLASQSETEPAARSDDSLRRRALAHLTTSQTLAEALRERFPRDTAGLSRAGFLARRAYVQERTVELLIAEGRYREALAAAERAKSRSFQDFVALRSAASSVHTPADRSSADRSSADRSVDEVLADWPEGTVALEYFLTDQHAWVFVIAGSGDVTALALEQPGGQRAASRQLVQSVQQFVTGLRGTSQQMLRRHMAGLGFDNRWQDQLHAYYTLLIPAEAQAKLQDRQQLIVVPHHILHYFPFAALVTEVDTEPRGDLEMPQPRFLIDRDLTLCTVPSLTSWDMLRRGTPEAIVAASAIGIEEFEDAPSLPGVEQDLANFRAAFAATATEPAVRNGGPTEPGEEGQENALAVLQGDAASESRVRQFLARPGLLFVATHGMNLADQPLDSFLLCHRDAKHDGRLTAAEILEQPVGADVVVLSACYSGLADRSPLPGDDLFGLERALLQSGASNVVCGLWDVYDDTGAELMNGFFQALGQGRTVPASLADSQRAFLQRRRAEGSYDPWIHPYFWAVYKATGSDRTIVGRSD
ncbi:CHAT domain-containing protein [Roseimaritima sediminicola]|uniref:CHAT domain-containing protein n=1 Tax=Roseimaritima sediminicola TaxID=2662066 RepID=UPI0012983F90|nr:CHAT domain-containing protein [Roseimaritima sediminicola]